MEKTFFDILTREQIEKFMRNAPSRDTLSRKLNSCTYQHIRLIASAIYSDGKFVYPSDVCKLVSLIEDNL
jgi:hypothetical protein